MLSSAVSPNGAVVVEQFAEWLTAGKRRAAQVLKQGRLLREERVGEGRRKGGMGAAPGDS